MAANPPTPSKLHALLNPGYVPKLQNFLLQKPLPLALKTLLKHPAGLMTIHFWAPTCKWMISIANMADIQRPVETLSVPQQIAIATTGVIWSRYSMVVIPKNYNLLSVNSMMAVTGIYQLYRIATHDPSVTPA